MHVIWRIVIAEKNPNNNVPNILKSDLSIEMNDEVISLSYKKVLDIIESERPTRDWKIGAAIEADTEISEYPLIANWKYK